MPMAMTDIGPGDVRNVPPVPPPDVLVPDEDLENAEIDLPIEDRPDTGTDFPDESEEPEEEMPDGGLPWIEEIERHKKPYGDAPPPLPEKERKPDEDEPLPEPERAPTVH